MKLSLINSISHKQPAFQKDDEQKKHLPDRKMLQNDL